MSYNVVWFKRDLRVHDHAALCHAARQGRVLCLYVIEPSYWRQDDVSSQHYGFVLESLRDLYRQLRRLGATLHVVTGEVSEVLTRLHQLAPFEGLYAHEETGNDLTFQRDKAVGRWCRQHGVGWHEYAQFGVVRRLASRDAWQSAWEEHMSAPAWPEPVLKNQPLPWQEPPPPTAAQLGIHELDPPQRQRGGETLGLSVLHDFLADRCAQYRGGISSPLCAPEACSRLSPYLAWGNVSMRHVVQETRGQLHALAGASTARDERRRKGLNAFTSRLYWHCHFIQKLESEPELEWRNLHRGYDGLREPDWNPAHFDALTQGRTGWPLVDACVAMLKETGWLNFRMRAMLVSAAAYPLWLHWRPVGLWLARHFLDYEPGIHWSQMQMQSGTTGINTTRVYNPIKQAQDQDPQGHFVRRWLPALRRVPDTWLWEPWRMPPDLQTRLGLRVGPGPDADIPLPCVDLSVALRTSKARLHALRAQPEVRAGKTAIVEKHGSRQRPHAGSRRAPTRVVDQLNLEFD
ncbi:MAG: deoxyribodipyrimidine photo-lyase [Burkholderiales bacterium]|nr:deoxyribodipyrimidine photo-lyase [Burkholderiales bacterium]